MAERLVQSQPASAGSEVNYHWVCLFNWCENDPNPFSIYVRETTHGIIPESWFSKPLSDANRQQKAVFKPMQSQVMSVFAKIEYGKKDNLLLNKYISNCN